MKTAILTKARENLSEERYEAAISSGIALNKRFVRILVEQVQSALRLPFTFERSMYVRMNGMDNWTVSEDAQETMRRAIESWQVYIESMIEDAVTNKAEGNEDWFTAAAYKIVKINFSIMLMHFNGTGTIKVFTDL